MPDELGVGGGAGAPGGTGLGGTVGGTVGGTTGGVGAAGSVGARAEAQTEIDRSDAADEVEALLAENAALKERIVDLEASMARAEALQELERALLDAGVVDLETAMALAGPRLDAGETAGDISASLRAGKAFLFAGSAPGRSAGAGSTQAGRGGAVVSRLETMAEDARRTGDRRSLTRYLRHRRQG